MTASDSRERNEYTGTRAEALIAAYQAVPLFDLAPSYVMTKADFNKAIIAALNHMEDANAASLSDPPVGKDSSFEERLIAHERLCMEDLWLAFKASDPSRSIAPVTERILSSREDLSRYVAKQREESLVWLTHDKTGNRVPVTAKAAYEACAAQVLALQSEIERQRDEKINPISSTP